MIWKRLHDSGKQWRHVYKVAPLARDALYSTRIPPPPTTTTTPTRRRHRCAAPNVAAVLAEHTF